MLGGPADAEDAVQETLVRAWRGAASFEGRSSVRSWIYRIATNVCLDMLRIRRRRERPMDLGPPSPPDASRLGPLHTEHEWVLPVPDRWVLDPTDDPAAVAEAKETVRLAFVAALQRLPARQRAVLILRDVLHFPASQTAELLDTSVAAVNSALQRARARLADAAPDAEPAPVTEDQQVLLTQYLEAFEAYDIGRLVRLLHDDAVQSMPPYAMCLQGSTAIGRWLLGPGIECRGSRLVATSANGSPAFGLPPHLPS